MPISRRTFLWSSVTVGLGLAIGVASFGTYRYIRNRRRAPPLGADAWIEIGKDGRIRIFSNATEMGQGSWSALAQLVCEELEADWTMVTVSNAPVRREFHAPWGYSTGGSNSVRGMFDMMRRIGASGRLLLIEAAAQRWNVSATECYARLGVITHRPTGRTLDFGAVASEAAALPLPEDPPLKSRAEWTLIGRSARRVDVAGKLNGSARFNVDIRLPDMRFAAIAHCPVPGGRLKSVDDTPAFAVAGIEQVVRLDDALAVVAKDTWTAMRGLARLKPSWDPGDNAATDSEEMLRAFHAAIDADQGEPYFPEGADKETAATLPATLAQSSSRLAATYQAPLIAHVPAEPMNATAWFRKGALEIWAPTQQQSWLQSEIAKALSIDHEKVIVHTPLVGGGFGRRIMLDYGIEAALIARQCPHPVQVLWSREEDFLRGYFRPAAVARFQAGFGADGQVRALDIHVASLASGPRMGGLSRLPYGIDAVALRYSPVPRGIRIGSWRSVDASQNSFFLESFLDECAAHAKRDPLDFRLELLKSNARARRVLEAVAELSSWAQRGSTGRHLGLAFASGWDSLAAHVAEAVVTDGKLRIAKIFTVVDCGTAVNPDNIVAQMQGGIMMAFSAAMTEEITVRDGRVQQTSYAAYPILRMSQAPTIEVRILESPEAAIGGIGEISVPQTAPAVANAVFSATGVRLRTLPLRKDTRVQWAM